MGTNGGAVDALQRELIKGGKSRKKAARKDDLPKLSNVTKRELQRLVRKLKG